MKYAIDTENERAMYTEIKRLTKLVWSMKGGVSEAREAIDDKNYGTARDILEEPRFLTKKGKINP